MDCRVALRSPRNDGTFSEPFQTVIARRVSAVAIQGWRRAQKDRLSRRPDSLFARARMVLKRLTAGIGWREPGAYGMTAA